ncbi:OB-fold protein [Pollutibacter soli]|uniref:OB-fold protein n=1 Tax=Pollutibacter soli TaxID=3034157 RepID=UPI003013275E
MRKRRLALIAVVILAIAGMVWWYVWNKPHRDVSNEKSISIGADSLFARYNSNEADANKQFLDKAISVHGVVQEIITNQQGQPVILFATGDPIAAVSATLRDQPGIQVKNGDRITVKGICSGFASDVVLRECILVTE